MPDWSQPSTYTTGTGVHHGYATARASVDDYKETVPSDERPNYDQFERAWYAKLDPGGFILPHTDAGPWVERWHYPIQPAGYIWQEDDGIVESPLDPFQVAHHRPHAVWNPHHIARIHLIVEYDNAIDEPTRGLEVFDPLPEMADLVRNADRMTRV